MRWSGELRCGLLVPIGAAVLLTACGEDAPPVPGAPASAQAVVPDALPGTPAEVADALLTIDDLGAGWTDLGAVPLDERGADECPAGQVVTAGDDPRRLGEAQSVYAEHDPGVPTFGESVSLWTSAEVAGERLAEFASLPTSCPPYEREIPDAGTATVSHRPAEASPLGHEAAAVVHEIEMPDGTTVLRDVVVVRIGDALVLTEGPDVAEDDPALEDARQQFRDLTAHAVDKAARTLASS